MPVHLNLPETFTARIQKSKNPLIGLWSCSTSPLVSEITASSGADWILLDAEHSPNSLETILGQINAMNQYGVSIVLRAPSDDRVLIKQYLDMGVQNLLIPMVNTPAQAAELVKSISYPQTGARGVGAALSRSSRWNRVDRYLEIARKTVSLTVQIETQEAVKNAADIILTPGIDAVFVGPSDLAASMGYLGDQSHADVVQAVLETIDLAKSLGKLVGVNAFLRDDADRYLARGADFVAVGADVSILARGTEELIDSFKTQRREKFKRASY